MRLATNSSDTAFKFTLTAKIVCGLWLLAAYWFSISPANAAPIIVTPGGFAGYLYQPSTNITVNVTGSPGGGGGEGEGGPGGGTGGGGGPTPPTDLVSCSREIDFYPSTVEALAATTLTYTLVGGGGGSGGGSSFSSARNCGGGGGGATALRINGWPAMDEVGGVVAIAPGGDGGDPRLPGHPGQVVTGTVTVATGDVIDFVIGGGGGGCYDGVGAGGGAGYYGGGGGSADTTGAGAYGGKGGGTDKGGDGGYSSNSGRMGSPGELYKGGRGGYGGGGGGDGNNGGAEDMGGGGGGYGSGGGGSEYNGASYGDSARPLHTSSSPYVGGKGVKDRSRGSPGQLLHTQGGVVLASGGDAGHARVTYQSESCWVKP